MIPANVIVTADPAADTAGDTASFDLSRLWSASFPSADLVTAAGALLTPLRNGFNPVTRTVTCWDGSEGPRSRLTIGPGVVSVGQHDRARAERTAERAIQSRSKNADVDAVEMGLPELLTAAREQVDAMTVLATSGLIAWDDLEKACDRLDVLIQWRDQVYVRGEKAEAGRKAVVTWSRRSRARMVRRLAELDYAPLFLGGALPAMLTLTYPGDWESVAGSAKTCKRHMDALAKRFQRSWDLPLLAVWKREFQRRGAPHYHLLMVPPPGVSLDSRLAFGPWVAAAWADIVGAESCGGEPSQDGPREVRRGWCCERHAHVSAGTAVDYAEGMRAQDPKRLAIYFSKHGAYGAKEYQNNAPDLWVENGSVGRFWGVWGLDTATVTVEVSPVEAIAAARTLRRWQNANGYRAQREVWRTNTATGAMRKRRSGTWSGSRMRGSLGFVIVNDGASFGSQLARYLDQVREAAQDAEIQAWLASPVRLRSLENSP